MEQKIKVKTITLLLVLIISVCLTTPLLSSLSRDILRTLTRLGITPSREAQTFSFTIEPENLKPGNVIAYKSFAQDMEGNWKETELKIFSVESVSTIPTTTITTTRPSTTTIQVCALEGDPCRSNEHCCYGYCCDGICSSSECKAELGFLKYLIAIPVVVVIGLVIVWMRSSRRTEEDEFDKLKEKWSRGGQQ